MGFGAADAAAVARQRRLVSVEQGIWQGVCGFGGLGMLHKIADAASLRFKPRCRLIRFMELYG